MPITYPVKVGAQTVTEIRVTLQTNKGKLLALVNVTFTDFAVKGIKVIEGSAGIFAAMSNQKIGDAWRDNYHFVTAEGNKAFCDLILQAYNEGITQ
jgi:DNA-binding cell septation regulator SpoVG